MLELNHYFVHEIENLKDFFLVSYVIIDDIYKEIIPKRIRFRRNYNCSKLSDSEIITLAVVGELHGIPSEKAWFNYVRKNFKDLFPNLGDRSRFNRTRRNLQTVIEAVRNHIGKYLGYDQAGLLIVDSMPIHVCGFGRAHFGKRFRDIASYSYCASKKETYYGFNLHALVTIEGFITNIEITPAHVDDRVALRDLLPHNYKTTILGDKGYIGDSFAAELKEGQNTLLLALKRDNAKNPYPKELRNWISKHRRRIETTFSQLTDQLNIHQVLAYSISGLKARISSKLLAHNIAYFMNKCLGKSSFNEVGKIKHLIFV